MSGANISGTRSLDDDRVYLDLCRYKVGLPPVSTPISVLRPLSGRYTYEQLIQTEWSQLFESLMRNRLIMGALRYGVIGEPGKPHYNRIASIQKRIALYSETGNMEHLVDVANEALLEFACPYRPGAHWIAQDDSSYHTEVMEN